MKLRHILPAEGASAVYAIPTYPYVREIPLLNWALVTRQRISVDNEGRETVETADDLVGLAVFGSVIAADEPSDGSVFGFYDHPGRYNDIELQQMKQQLEAYGHQMSLYLQAGEE